MAVIDAFKDFEVVVITYKFPSFDDFEHPNVQKLYQLKYFGGAAIRLSTTLLLSCFTYVKIFLKEKPDVIFSTGSEIALPAFYIGKYLFSAKLIFLESLTRVVEPSLTAKLVYNSSDLFLVQSESLLKKFGSKATYAGNIL